MKFRNLSLKSIRTFEAAARLGSFKQAAEELFVTPQAVSIQMKLLEDRLQVPLYRRSARGIELTDAGRTLLEHVQQAFELIESGINSISSQQQATQLQVSSSPFFVVHYLLPHLAAFEQQHPDIKVNLNAALKLSQENDAVDVAIKWGFGDWPHAHKRLLLRDDKLLVCSPALLQQHPLNQPQDLASLRLLCTELSVNLWERFAQQLGVNMDVAKQVFCLDSHASMLEAAIAGLGIALISESEARAACQAGTLVMPLGDWSISDLNPALTPGYWLLCRDYSHRREVRCFADWVVKISEAAAQQAD